MKTLEELKQEMEDAWDAWWDAADAAIVDDDYAAWDAAWDAACAAETAYYKRLKELEDEDT